MKVTAGKFSILFPELERPEERMGTAQSILVKYRTWSEWKSDVIDNSNEIRDLVSAISVRRTLRCRAGGIDQDSSTVRFLLPDGQSMTIAFGTPTHLTLEDWGQIDLGSGDFYDKICAVLSKREGRPVKLAEADPKP